LEEKCRLRAFGNRVLRRIFGPRRNEVTGEWKRLLLTIYHPGYQVKKTKMGRVCSTNRKRRGANRVLVGKPEGRIPLAKPRCRWENNTKMNPREMGWEEADWIDLAQDRDRRRTLVTAVTNLRVR
jgi:hypothetical protein